MLTWLSMQWELDLAPFISHEITIAELPTAIEEARVGKAMKVLVLP